MWIKIADANEWYDLNRALKIWVEPAGSLPGESLVRMLFPDPIGIVHPAHGNFATVEEANSWIRSHFVREG